MCTNYDSNYDLDTLLDSVQIFDQIELQLEKVYLGSISGKFLLARIQGLSPCVFALQ